MEFISAGCGSESGRKYVTLLHHELDNQIHSVNLDDTQCSKNNGRPGMCGMINSRGEITLCPNISEGNNAERFRQRLMFHLLLNSQPNASAA